MALVTTYLTKGGLVSWGSKWWLSSAAEGNPARIASLESKWGPSSSAEENAEKIASEVPGYRRRQDTFKGNCAQILGIVDCLN